MSGAQILDFDEMANNEEEAAQISTEKTCLAHLSFPSTSSASSTTSSCEEGGQKRKVKGCSEKAHRMKISEGCNNSERATENQRLDPCHSLPPELFRRILSSLGFISMRHAMLVSRFLSRVVTLYDDVWTRQVSRGWRNAAECPSLWRKLRCLSNPRQY